MTSGNEVSRERVLAWMRLGGVRGWGPVLVKRVVEGLGSPEAVLGADVARMGMVEGIGRVRAEGFARGLAGTKEAAEREWEEAAARGIRIICRDDAEWPAGLKGIGDPPVVLYVRGKMVARDAVAVGVVGSRECTLYGLEQAERFGALLAGAGICVVSGGARGIDTGAHRGALRAKGRTIVVQGCGLLHCYPPENAELYRQIEERGEGECGGAVISELGLNVGPARENFPPRNRIIAGMSLGVLVVEANKRSGSLITARLAADDYGREVFAVPGRVDSAASAGTHELIKKGAAHLVEGLGDILEGLGDVGAALEKQKEVKEKSDGKKGGTIMVREGTEALFDGAGREGEGSEKGAEMGLVELTAVQRKIMEVMEADAGKGVSVDDICERTEISAGVVMAELTMLQIRGLLQRGAGNRFARKKAGARL